MMFRNKENQIYLFIFFTLLEIKHKQAVEAWHFRFSENYLGSGDSLQSQNQQDGN